MGFEAGDFQVMGVKTGEMEEGSSWATRSTGLVADLELVAWFKDSSMTAGVHATGAWRI